MTDIRKEAEELAKWHELEGNIENLIVAVFNESLDELDQICNQRVLWHQEQAALIRSLLSQLPGEGEVVVPREPTEVQWNGLARTIIMWMSMFSGSALTPRNLFDHLTRSGQEIPRWLKDEPEMQALDHVPSKGTRCCIIYKAMIKENP